MDSDKLKYGHRTICDGFPCVLGFGGLRMVTFQLSGFCCITKQDTIPDRINHDQTKAQRIINTRFTQPPVG